MTNLLTIMSTLEVLIQITALGFISGKDAYLKDPWNWIDFKVVVTSLFSILPGVQVW